MILHSGTTESTEELANTFGNTLMAIGNMLSRMDEIEGRYIKRIQCLLRVFLVTRHGIQITTAIPNRHIETYRPPIGAD